MARFRKYRVLHIEDDESDRRAVAHALIAQRNFAVVDAGTLKGGIAALADAKSPFDAVILDLSLPDGAGLLSVEKVVSEAGTAPVIACSDGANALIGLEAVDRGAAEYLVKDQALYPALPRIIQLCVERHALSVRSQEFERKWRYAEGLFVGVMNVIDEAVTVVDRSASFQVVNHAMSKLTGRPVAHMIGLPFYEIFPEDRREKERAAFAARLAGAPPTWRASVEVLRADGTTALAEARSTRVDAGQAGTCIVTRYRAK